MSETRPNASTLRLVARDIRVSGRRPLRLWRGTGAGRAARHLAARIAARYGAVRGFGPGVTLSLLRPRTSVPAANGYPRSVSHHAMIHLRPRLALTYLQTGSEGEGTTAASADDVRRDRRPLPAGAPPSLPSFQPRLPARLARLEERAATPQRIRTSHSAQLSERIMEQGRRVEGLGVPRYGPSDDARGPAVLPSPGAGSQVGAPRPAEIPAIAPVRRTLHKQSPSAVTDSPSKGEANAPGPGWGHLQRSGPPSSSQSREFASSPPVNLPPQELNRVTDHVIQTLERRIHAFRERTGRI